VGKVLLANGTRELQEAVLGSLDRYTGSTITDASVLEAQLKDIKRLGFAHSQEELAVGATSLAVPITGYGNKVTAALGIVTPVANTDLERMVSVLKVSAAALSKKLVLSGMGDLSQRV
jgi:DNA-binding IclR family transcriptional regulator